MTRRVGGGRGRRRKDGLGRFGESCDFECSRIGDFHVGDRSRSVFVKTEYSDRGSVRDEHHGGSRRTLDLDSEVAAVSNDFGHGVWQRAGMGIGIAGDGGQPHDEGTDPRPQGENDNGEDQRNPHRGDRRPENRGEARLAAFDQIVEATPGTAENVALHGVNTPIAQPLAAASASLPRFPRGVVGAVGGHPHGPPCRWITRCGNNLSGTVHSCAVESSG